MSVPDPLRGFTTLRELAGLIGAPPYSTLYSMSVGRKLGEPVSAGRTLLFRRDVAERAIAERAGNPRRPSIRVREEANVGR